jgi:signal transduction histidine kinase
VATRSAGLRGGAFAVAAVLTVGGVIGARAAGTAADSARENGARRAATATTRAFDASVEGVRRTVDSVALLAPRIAATPTAPPAQLPGLLSDRGVRAVAVVPVKGRPAVVAGVLPRGLDPVAVAANIAAARDVARDTGDPHAGVAGHDIAVAIPVYDGAAVSTEERRAALSAWVVAVVDSASLVGGATADGETAVLDVGGVTVTPPAKADGTSADVTAILAGQPLHLVVTAPEEGGARAIALSLLLLGILGAAGALLVGVIGERALGRSQATTDALERETRTVAEIGPLLQQSLDLAEVLPAVAVRLSDEFQLESFAVELVGEHGEPVDVFAVGRRSAGDAEVFIGPEGVPAGRQVALPLLRAGRTIGRLRLAPRDHLTTIQVDALRGAADLIAVATYNVELYEREQATVRRLQELDTLKDAFLGTISHELRTPITAISGFTRMLNERWDDLSEEMRRDFLRRVGRNSASLGMLVDDLLDFARLERQALQTNVTPLPLDSVVAGFVAQVVPALGDHPVETDLSPGVVALADPRAIERVLANLLTNAAKFSPPGAQIDVALRQGDASAVLTVSDRGPGIAAEDRLRVFTRFYRGESDVARSTRGAGIGLAVVHELVTQMGGDIAVRGRQPNGTTMVVRLPLAVPAESLIDPDLPAPREAEDLIPARSKP